MYLHSTQILMDEQVEFISTFGYQLREDGPWHVIVKGYVYEDETDDPGYSLIVAGVCCLRVALWVRASMCSRVSVCLCVCVCAYV